MRANRQGNTIEERSPLAARMGIGYCMDCSDACRTTAGLTPRDRVSGGEGGPGLSSGDKLSGPLVVVGT